MTKFYFLEMMVIMGIFVLRKNETCFQKSVSKCFYGFQHEAHIDCLLLCSRRGELEYRRTVILLLMWDVEHMGNDLLNDLLSL